MFIPKKAFVLAAGYGTRMRPLTDERPKPLVKVAGRGLLDHIVDRLEEVGVEHVVVNAHYLSDQVVEWAKGRTSPQITVVVEDELLDTGGGVVNVLNFFGGEPFYVVAGDAFWVDGPDTNILKALARRWNDEDMDMIMALQDIGSMRLTTGLGDYDVHDDGRAVRSLDKSGSAMFANIRINHPRLYKDAPDGAFSFLQLMDTAESEGRLYAVLNEGQWHHISTPADLERVNEDVQG